MTVAHKRINVRLASLALGALAVLFVGPSVSANAQPLGTNCSNPVNCTSGSCQSGQCCSGIDFGTACDAGLSCQDGGTCCCGDTGASCNADYRQTYNVCCTPHGGACGKVSYVDQCCMANVNSPYECVLNGTSSPAGTCQSCQYDGYFLDAGIDAGSSCCFNHSDKLRTGPMYVCCQAVGGPCDSPYEKCCDSFDVADKSDAGVLCAYTAADPTAKRCCIPIGGGCPSSLDDGGTYSACCSGSCCDGICQ